MGPRTPKKTRLLLKPKVLCKLLTAAKPGLRENKQAECPTKNNNTFTVRLRCGVTLLSNSKKHGWDRFLLSPPCPVSQKVRLTSVMSNELSQKTTSSRGGDIAERIRPIHMQQRIAIILSSRQRRWEMTLDWSVLG